MQKLTVVLAALGTIGTAGIATVLFCIGVYAEAERGRTWRAWHLQTTGKRGGTMVEFLVTLLAVGINVILILGVTATAVWIRLYLADM